MSNLNLEAQSPRKVDVMVLVDVAGALHDKVENLGKYVWMVDTTSYTGGSSEGTNALVTAVGNNQTIVWTVVPIDSDTSAGIVSFQGVAINDKRIKPQRLPGEWDAPWQATTFIPLETKGTKYQYTMTLQFGDGNDTSRQMTFDPYLLSTT